VISPGKAINEAQLKALGFPFSCKKAQKQESSQKISSISWSRVNSRFMSSISPRESTLPSNAASSGVEKASTEQKTPGI
jgi:hypothetical protein